MLNREDAQAAIEYFYKDVENLSVGTPLPYVKTINTSNMDAFNELMVDGSGNIKNIFYGRLTWVMNNSAPAPVDTYIDVFLYLNNLTTGTEIHPLYIDSILNPNTFLQGTTEGIFLHSVQGEAGFALNLDGYLFSVTSKP